MFNFVCAECGEFFETWVPSSSAVDEVTCPACESDQVEKQLSRVARMKVSGGIGSIATTSGSSCSPGGG